MSELLTGRDALAKALDAHVYQIDQAGAALCRCGWPSTRRGIETDLQTAHRAHVTDALFASGAVIDVSTLADDEALIEEVWGRLPAPLPVRENDVPYVLRALAAALTERGADRA